MPARVWVGGHPSGDELELYSLGRLPEAELALLEEHLLVCEHCRRRVLETDEYVALLRGGLRRHFGPVLSLCVPRFPGEPVPRVAAADRLTLQVDASGMAANPAALLVVSSSGDVRHQAALLAEVAVETTVPHRLARGNYTVRLLDAAGATLRELPFSVD